VPAGLFPLGEVVLSYSSSSRSAGERAPARQHETPPPPQVDAQRLHMQFTRRQAMSFLGRPGRRGDGAPAWVRAAAAGWVRRCAWGAKLAVLHAAARLHEFGAQRVDDVLHADGVADSAAR
jgi:hypothetical protein